MPLIEVFASPRLAECEHRALVLRAVGIEHVVTQQEDLYVLLVPSELLTIASEHLRSYDAENRPKPQPAPLVLHDHAWRGSIVYAVVLMSVAYCTGDSVGGIDWIKTGALTSATIHQHEWWRSATALTLHADIEHLVGNLVFGMPYGFFASQLLGGGLAWASIVAAAVLANLIESTLMNSTHATIGASTAVFTMLALVASYSWRAASSSINRWARRWSPWIAAVALLAMTGVGSEHTDAVAHIIGFACGAAIGLVQSYIPIKTLERRSVQVVSGVAAFTAVISAWAWAYFSK